MHCDKGKFVIAAGLFIFLSGCGAKYGQVFEENQISIRQNFAQGKAVLDCGLICAGRYGFNRLEIKALYDSQQWTELSDRVMSIGFQIDQTWFYLGRAAEGLGHSEAARTYYNRGLAESHKCKGSKNLCDGLEFPRDIDARLKILAYPQYSTLADRDELAIDGLWKTENGLPLQISKGKMYLLATSSSGIPPGSLIAKEIAHSTTGKFSCKAESYNNKSRVLDFGNAEFRLISMEKMQFETYPNPITGFAGSIIVFTKTTLTNEKMYEEEIAAITPKIEKTVSASTSKVSKAESGGGATEIREDLPVIVKRITPCTVTIRAYKADGKTFLQGSGFFINPEGDVITCNHVLSGTTRTEIITSTGEKHSLIKAISGDNNVDIARLSVRGIRGKAPYLNVSPTPPQLGERIVVIGTPEGLAQTISDGIVSGFREVSGFGRVIQIAAAISPGSSGSPVINMKGEVIGVAVATKTSGQSLNFAIPGEAILKIAKISANTFSSSQTL